LELSGGVSIEDLLSEPFLYPEPEDFGTDPEEGLEMLSDTSIAFKFKIIRIARNAIVNR
jgi:hypothetical protein